MKLRKFISMGGRASSSELRSRIALRLPSCVLASAVALCATLSLTGCSVSFDPKLSGGAAISSATGATFTGRLHGGQQPIANAYIFVFQVGEAGYPGGGVASNVSIISSNTVGSFNGTVNGNNYGPYVLTDSNGNFSFTLNNCTTGDGVYVVSYQGQPITGQTNTAASEMAAVGICPANGVSGLLQNTPFVNVTEVSTVAFAYAMGGFTAAGQDFSHISTSATNITAMQAAFNLAQQLFSVNTTGGANTSSASLAGATFPAAKINTMANIIADCINSNGSASGPCGTLFQNATSNGTAGSGTVPQDTISALINITHNLQSNVSAIYPLANNTYAPYSPTLTGGFNDFVMSIQYSASGMHDPYQMAIDSSGSVYALSYYSSTGSSAPSITKFSPATGFVGITSLSSYSSLAIDLNNNVLIVNQNGSAPTVAEYASSATAALGAASSHPPVFTPSASGYLDVGYQPIIAVGPTDNVILDDASAIYTVPYSSGSYGTSTVSNTSQTGGSYGLAVDGVGNTWWVNHATLYSEKLSSTGTLTSLNLAGAYPTYNAVDPEGREWVIGYDQTTNNTIWWVNSAADGFSQYNTNPVGFASTNSNVPLSIDGLGNIWTGSGAGGYCRINALNSGGVQLFSNYGLFVDGTSASGCATNGQSISQAVIDQGGNIWVAVRTSSNYSVNGYLDEVLGVAAPTIEPLSLQSQKLLPTNTSFDIRP